MHTIIKKLTRELTLAVCFFLPAEKKRRIERWLRGREEARKLRLADAVVVSYGKAGRTWVRVMISRFYSLTYGLSERSLIGFDNLHRKNRAIPKIHFTHDNYLKDYTGHTDDKSDFYDKKVILLVRNPQDVAVSQYFQWQHRMRKRKKSLNDYPEHGADISAFDFVMREGSGLPKIIDFMNLWARELPQVKEHLVVRYEDLRADTEATFAKIAEFLGGPVSDETIRGAVEFASVENMRSMEQRRVFWLSGGRMTPGDKKNPASYKVRRAKVGGWRDYFDDAEIARIDEFVHSKLSPVFGYDREPEPGSGQVAS